MALLHLEPAAHLDGYWGKVCGWAFFIWNLSSILTEIEERSVVGSSLSSLFSSEFDKGASGEFGVSRFWYVLEELLMWRFSSFQMFRLLISHAYFLVSNVKWFIEFLKSFEILGNLEILLYFDEIIKWLLLPICLGNFGKSWEILGNLEILLYFDEFIKWLLFPICLGNLGKSWEILGNLESW